MSTLREKLLAMPKAELHHHFEGAVPWQLSRTYSSSDLPETPYWWDRQHRYDDWDEFRSAMHAIWLGHVTSLDQFHEAAHAIVASADAQNVVYLETTVALVSYSYRCRLDPSDVVGAIKAAARDRLAVRVFAAVGRSATDIAPIEEVVFGTDGTLDGIDLCGFELPDSTVRFADLFARAREEGLLTKAHAGEAGHTKSVEETVDVLQVERIEHGITAVEDPGLVEKLKQRKVVLDVCPWSNVKMRLVPSLNDHPIKPLHRAGVTVTVNSDDPTAFGHTLLDEYEWLVTQVGLQEAEVLDIAANGLRTAYADEGSRHEWLEQLQELRGPG